MRLPFLASEPTVIADLPVPENPPQLGKPAAGSDAPAGAPRKPRRTRRRWWFLLFLAATVSLLLSPAPWHAALRAFLTLRAARQGWDLRIGAIDGGLFDSTQLYHVRCSQRPPEKTDARAALPATDFQIERAELVIAWRWPWRQKPQGSWVRRVTVDGLHGVCDFSRVPALEPSASVWQTAQHAGWRTAAGVAARQVLARCGRLLARRLDRLDHELVPGDAEVQADDFTVQRGRYLLRVEGLRWTALQDEIGRFAARQVEVRGPASDSPVHNVAGWTYWKGSNLTFGDVDLGRGVRLVHATLDGEHLDRHRLGWDGELRALGGSARGQGSVDFSRLRLALAVAGSLEKMPVPPLARLLGFTGAIDGEVQQANFTFRGDPEKWAAAEMWLAAEATDFQWGQRRWESLALRGVILNRRVQVHQLELRQSRNQLSFSGECALPAVDATAAAPAGLTATKWWQAGFSCNIDARADDLHSLAQLAGGRLPDLSGRMSVNGKISAQAGAPGIEGYLNVEGSALSIRGAPLDFLHTTLLFQGDELNMADLQATRGGDYFAGKGTLQIIGPARYQVELHAAIKDLSVYAPAYADLAFSPQPVSGSLTLDWSGDGVPGANSGAFAGTTEHFFTKGGPAALARPMDLAAEGTYSPESVSFRHLVLKEGAGDQRRDALKLEGALPWTRDARAFAAGRWLEPDRPMSVRVACADAPLDLLAGLAPELLSGAGGQLTGWLNADGTLRYPRLEADLHLRNASFWPVGAPPAWENVDADVRVEKSVLQIGQATGRRGTQTIEVAGGVDLTDTAKIGLELTVHGNDAAGLHSEALDAGLSYALTLRGTLGDGAAISGEVNLLAGRYERPLVLGYDDFPVRAWLDLAAWLPFAWPGAHLDVRLGATPALRLAGGGADAGMMPDLQFTGTLPAPLLMGELTLRQAPLRTAEGWRGIGDGVWYFPGDAPGNPTVSIRARGDGGEQVLFYGPAAAGWTFSWPEVGPAPQWDQPSAMAAFGQ